MLGYEGTAKIIGDIAPTYFVAISPLVAAYFGANAYVDKKVKWSLDFRPVLRIENPKVLHLRKKEKDNL